MIPLIEVHAAVIILEYLTFMVVIMKYQIISRFRSWNDYSFHWDIINQVSDMRGGYK